MRGENYLGTVNKYEVHDLDHEDASANGFPIDEIIRAGHDGPYESLQTSRADGYDNCAKCLLGSAR